MDYHILNNMRFRINYRGRITFGGISYERPVMMIDNGPYRALFHVSGGMVWSSRAERTYAPSRLIFCSVNFDNDNCDRGVILSVIDDIKPSRNWKSWRNSFSDRMQAV